MCNIFVRWSKSEIFNLTPCPSPKERGNTAPQTPLQRRGGGTHLIKSKKTKKFLL
jgi:hypothetical protein